MMRRKRSWVRWVFILSFRLGVFFLLLSLLMVAPLRWVNPVTSMVIVERWFNGGDDFELRQEWLDWDELPKHAVLAVVTSEDQRFPEHQGFDLVSIRDALAERERGGQLRGASTLTQQVARNLYLWTGRSWVRKGLEAWFTVLLEALLPKHRILEIYMNIAEWGPNGVFGLEAAAQHHFNRSADRLIPYQSALLAATLPSPARYTPGQATPYMRERASWIIDQQRMLGGTAWLAPIEP
ncbi:monofunctional biosynthetic peptidoglycan transglycosylase [Saccharospirillum mangrovi]|uniref:Biosynthetic peptidoglycan transglycosylase n=2 Tax=Saccharospirillaceae TaxID=255527 RepID=A0ABV7ZU39_9GAMM